MNHKPRIASRPSGLYAPYQPPCINPLVIEKEEAECGDVRPLRRLISQLSVRGKDHLSNRGTVDVRLNGYQNDVREVYEIPEIRHWYTKTIEDQFSWFYWLYAQPGSHGLNNLYFSTTTLRQRFCLEKGNAFLGINLAERKRWLGDQHRLLRRFAASHGIDAQVIRGMCNLASLHFVTMGNILRHYVV